MRFYILTLFPEMIKEGLNHSMISRAQENKIIQVDPINIRDFSKNKHQKVDDYPYGGGPGMVMQPGPIYDAYKTIADQLKKTPRVIYMTPQGKTFNQAMAKELSTEKELIFLCGHYEGIDQRVIDQIVTDEISIGDYVLTGGELAAMVIIDAVARLVPGVLGKQQSFEQESFSNYLLEYPQYTRPPVFNEKLVPKVLLSGHHGKIEQWRRQQSIMHTFEKRPDLLKKAELTKEDKKFLEQFQKNS